MGKGRASLAELMGTNAVGVGEGMSLEHLPHILGESMPELPKNAVGRHRLIRSLQQRFGPNFRSLPGVSGLVKQFDEAIDNEHTLNKIAAIKLGDFKRGITR